MEILNIITDNPIIMVGIIVAVLVLIGVPILLIWQPNKKNYIPALLFTRNNEFDFIKCESVADIASYETGGFDIDEKAMTPYVFGGTKLELGRIENRKEAKPLFQARVGDTGAMMGTKSGFTVKKMDKDEYHRRESIAAENARNQAAKKITSIDLINVSLVIVMIILALPLAAIGLRMAQQ